MVFNIFKLSWDFYLGGISYRTEYFLVISKQKIINCLLCLCKVFESRLCLLKKKKYDKIYNFKLIPGSDSVRVTLLLLHIKPSQLEIFEHFLRFMGKNVINRLKVFPINLTIDNIFFICKSKILFDLFVYIFMISRISFTLFLYLFIIIL